VSSSCTCVVSPVTGFDSGSGRSTFTTLPTRPHCRTLLFRVVYGHDPPSIRSYEPDEMWVAVVAKNMADRAEAPL
jgi:hypothetical protein